MHDKLKAKKGKKKQKQKHINGAVIATMQDVDMACRTGYVIESSLMCLILLLALVSCLRLVLANGIPRLGPAKKGDSAWNIWRG